MNFLKKSLYCEKVRVRPSVEAYRADSVAEDIRAQVERLKIGVP